MITINRIKNIAKDIMSDDEWVNDSHSRAEYNGVVMGLKMLIKHLEETTKLKAVRCEDFDELRESRPYAVCLDLYDLDDELLESGADWSYFSTEEEAEQYINEFNKQQCKALEIL